MKILKIIPDLFSGGAEKLVKELRPLLNTQTSTCDILTLQNCQTSSDIGLHSLGLETPYQAFASPTTFTNWYMRHGPYDIVHLHLTPSQLLAPYIKQIDPKPVLITTEHSTTNRRRNSKLGIIFDTALYHHFSMIVCISHGCKTLLTRDRPYLTNKTVVIQNGIDLSKIQAAKPTKQPTLILSAGRLVPAKNFKASILALKAIETLDFKYLIAGDGPEKASLQELIIRNDLHNKIELVGKINDIPQFLSNGSIFLTPSISEGFGLAAVEAMAAGLAIVSSDVPGLREVVGENDTSCLMSEPEDIYQISNNIKSLIENEELRKHFQAKARQRAAMFSIHKTAQKHLSLYNQLLCTNTM